MSDMKNTGKPSSGMRTTSVRGNGDGLNTATSSSVLRGTRRSTPETREPLEHARRWSAPPARSCGRSGCASGGGPRPASSRRSSRAPGSAAACATRRAATAARRACRVRVPSAAHGSAHPSSACSARRFASFRSRRADHTPGSRLAVRAPRSSPRCSARPAGSIASDEIVEQTARHVRVPCVAPSAAATAAVWSSGSMWSMPFISSAGARSIGPRRSEHAEQAVDRRRPGRAAAPRRRSSPRPRWYASTLLPSGATQR